MTELENIKNPVAEEMLRYEHYLKESLHSDHGMTQTMLSYVLESRGKGIRPLLVMLTAAMLGDKKELPEDTMLGAMLVEMIHTASLVHDDVIDEAYIRRGKPSAKAMWRSHRAVLIGDYILSKVFSVGMEKGSYELVRYVMYAMTDLVEGELMQSEQSDKLEMTRELYYSIIHKKTASLIGRSSGVGAFSVGAPLEQVKAMSAYGDSLGVAFQIKDDILDYTLTAKTGKPVCGDLRERKITIPLLTVLETSTDCERSEIISLLSDVRKKPANAEILCNMVVERGGLEMATKVMDEYVAAAKAQLELFPTSIYRDSLTMLCDYVAKRDV